MILERENLKSFSEVLSKREKFKIIFLVNVNKGETYFKIRKLKLPTNISHGLHTFLSNSLGTFITMQHSKSCASCRIQDIAHIRLIATSLYPCKKKTRLVEFVSRDVFVRRWFLTHKNVG